MAAKAKKSFGEYVSDGFQAVSERVGNFARTKFDLLIDKIEWRVMGLQDRMIRKITYSFLFGVASVFIALGAFYFLKEYLSFSNTASFFLIGILLLIGGMFVKSSERRVAY